MRNLEPEEASEQVSHQMSEAEGQATMFCWRMATNFLLTAKQHAEIAVFMCFDGKPIEK
jgi:hypothetical protein